MKQTINTAAGFRDVFTAYGRGQQFSYKGLGVLFEHLEDCDSDYELDIIGLCCDYTESSIADALKYYNLESIDELQDNTVVLCVDDDTIIYANY